MSTSDALDEINHILQRECREPMNFDYFFVEEHLWWQLWEYVLWRSDRWQMQKWPFCSIMVWFNKIKTGSLQNKIKKIMSTKPEPDILTVTTFILFYLFFPRNMNTPMLGTPSELLLNIAHQTPVCIELHMSVCLNAVHKLLAWLSQSLMFCLINKLPKIKKDADIFLSKSAVLFSGFIYLREPSNPSFHLMRGNDIHLN